MRIACTQPAAAVSLVLSLVLLGLAQLLLTAMRPSLVRPLVYFVSSASVLLFFLSLSIEHASGFVRSTARLALVVGAGHLSIAIGLLSGVVPASWLGPANANFILERVLLVLVLAAVRIRDERTSAASFQVAASVAIVIACFAAISTPVLFHARAVSLIVFYSALLGTSKNAAAAPSAGNAPSRLLATLTVAFMMAMGAASIWMCVAAYIQPSERVWMTDPRVVISAKNRNDARIADVVEGVRYWNMQLRRLGSPFRLDAVVLTDRLTEIDRKTLKDGDVGAETRKHLAEVGSSIVVALQEEETTSFVHDVRIGGSVVVVITAAQGLPGRPNILRNIVAHELGHAIGLQHTDVQESLMCGVPAPCGINRFEATHAHHFPLTIQDDQALLRWYPQSSKVR